MKKTLFLLVTLFVGIISANALTNAQKQAKIESILSNYHFNFKYVNMDEDIAMIRSIRGNNNWPDPEEYFFSFLIRDDLEEKIGDLTLGFDAPCHKKGDSYETYDDDLGMNVNKVADTDMCELYIIVGDSWDDCTGFELTITGNFEEVEGNASYKKEALKIAKEIQKDFYVNDMDIINHIFNYKSSTATFFQGNNVTTEFSDVKKAVEAYPSYTFSAGLEEVRRGDYFVGLEEGGTFISRDGIIYGYALNTYGAGSLFYVPIGTKEADYIKVVEQRIKDYLKDDSIKVKIEKTQYTWNDGENDHVLNYVNAKETVLNVLGMSESEYFKAISSSRQKQKVKFDDPAEASSCDDDYGCIAVPMYKLTIGNQELEIGIIEAPDNILNSNGLTTSTNKKTGIIIRTASANVPLDAMLDIKELELTKEEKAYLSANGFKEIQSYDLNLFSKILNKYIEKFNEDSEILIPVEEKNNKLKVVYISDDLKTLEEYDIEYVTLDGQLYMSFKTKHFSNYIIVEDTKNPPTGDNVISYVLLSTISLIGLAGILVTRKKNG
jgi:hypothetical protein